MGIAVIFDIYLFTSEDNEIINGGQLKSFYKVYVTLAYKTDN